MAGSRRVLLVLAISIAAVLAVVASLTTCAPDDVAQIPAGERPTETASRSPPRPAPARTPRARATADAEPAPTTAVAPQPAAGGLTGRVRVTVTCDGVAMPDADVLLASKPAKPAPPRPASSDGAYFDVPWYLGVTSRYDAGFGRPDANGVTMWAARKGTKGADGSVIFDAPVGPTYVVLAKSGNEWFDARERREVTPDPSRTIDVAFEVRRPAKIAGRCIDADDKPVADAWVQAIEPSDDVPASPLVRTDPAGAFALQVEGSRPSYRVRAVASRRLQLWEDASWAQEWPAVPADTTVSGVVPDGAPLEVRMARGRSVLLDVTGDVVFNHLQVEGLVWEPSSNAWGRLGGPVFLREIPADHAFAAVPSTDAERPFYVWSWGGPPMHTAVDPRGRDRVAIKLSVGRKVTVRGRGWVAGDRLRVVCRMGAAGAEIPVIWIDAELGGQSAWSRDDAPQCEVEFRLVRDGREIGAHPSVPAGKDEAPAVRIDL